VPGRFNPFAFLSFFTGKYRMEMASCYLREVLHFFHCMSTPAFQDPTYTPPRVIRKRIYYLYCRLPLLSDESWNGFLVFCVPLLYPQGIFPTVPLSLISPVFLSVTTTFFSLPRRPQSDPSALPLSITNHRPFPITVLSLKVKLVFYDLTSAWAHNFSPSGNPF